MGLVKTQMILKNPRRPDLQPMAVDTLADSGAVYLCISPHVQIQLDLQEIAKKEVTLTDARKRQVPYIDKDATTGYQNVVSWGTL